MEKVKNLVDLVGENVLVMCVNYFYLGKLTAAEGTLATIENPKIVFETGKWSDSNWSCAQSMHVPEMYINTDSIEAIIKTSKI